jgi:hypothetical protein
MLDMTRSRKVATRAVEHGAYYHGAKRGAMMCGVSTQEPIILRHRDHGIFVNSPLIPVVSGSNTVVLLYSPFHDNHNKS